MMMEQTGRKPNQRQEDQFQSDFSASLQMSQLLITSCLGSHQASDPNDTTLRGPFFGWVSSWAAWLEVTASNSLFLLQNLLN